jgi:hypothetical protein
MRDSGIYLSFSRLGKLAITVVVALVLAYAAGYGAGQARSTSRVGADGGFDLDVPPSLQRDGDELRIDMPRIIIPRIDSSPPMAVPADVHESSRHDICPVLW